MALQGFACDGGTPGGYKFREKLSDILQVALETSLDTNDRVQVYVVGDDGLKPTEVVFLKGNQLGDPLGEVHNALKMPILTGQIISLELDLKDPGDPSRRAVIRALKSPNGLTEGFQVSFFEKPEGYLFTYGHFVLAADKGPTRVYPQNLTLALQVAFKWVDKGQKPDETVPALPPGD